MSERIPLFANGTQFLDWTANNCDRCALAGDGSEPGSSQCELFEAIHDAGADDGTITPEVAKRLGHKDELYTWRCPEFTREVPWAVLHDRELAKLQAWITGEPIKG